jgi:hypothetical protein
MKEKQLPRIFNMIENYIYLYHTDTFIVIPAYPQQFSDSMDAQFSTETPIMRSAPIFSYSSSGPRTIDVNISMHREMMKQINYGVSNAKVTLTDDYVDLLIKQIQAAALPTYSTSSKMVDPPMVAIRFGNEIFCKGVVQGSVTVTYELPVLQNGKYAQVSLGFTVKEIDPYDANTVQRVGSFRGLDTTLERRLWKSAGRLL